MSKTAVSILTLLFLFFPDDLKNGVKTGLTNSFLYLLPSLFPYMVISSVFLYTGALDSVSAFLHKPINKLTGLSKNSAGVYILSLFCGYPTGARMSSELYRQKKISKKEYMRLFFFANAPGFGFCVSFLGGFYQNGIKIYFSYLITSLIINFILSRKNNEEHIVSNEKNYMPLYKSITDSIKESSNAMISITGFVCFFCAVSSLLKNFSDNNLLISLISGFLEISSGSYNIYNSLPFPYNMYTTVFLTGFSGFSIIFQSLFFLDEEINILTLICARIIFAIISTMIFFIINLL